MSDLISRSNAIRWIKAECNPYGQPTLDYESGIKIIEHLRRMPSEQSEPVRHGRWLTEYGGHIHVRRGKWKILDDTEFRAPGWYCSLCNYQISDRYGKYNYCPNCGAKMEEVV